MSSITRVGSVLLLVLSLVSLVAVPPSAAAATLTPRYVVTDTYMYLFDHETFGSDETAEVYDWDAKVLDNNQLQLVAYSEGRVGGEMRVELHVNATRTPDNSVFVTGRALLYEGTSESTGDLDGQRAFSFTVPPRTSIRESFTVYNTDEGDDYANISFVVGNWDA